jgi:hypothetical protein
MAAIIKPALVRRHGDIDTGCARGARPELAVVRSVAADPEA